MMNYETASLLGLKYFVFGFIDLEKTQPIIGAYDKNQSRFIIDYSKKKYKEIYESYIRGEFKLPVLTLEGVSSIYYKEILNNAYFLDSCFIIDAMCFNSIDENALGLLIMERGEEILFDVGVSGSYAWSTGQMFSSMYISLDYEDYFDSIDIKYRRLGNIYLTKEKQYDNQKE